jgi:hypothetical protein
MLLIAPPFTRIEMSFLVTAFAISSSLSGSIQTLVPPHFMIDAAILR